MPAGPVFHPLRLPAGSRYDCMIGTGGIGSGMFFALDGNHTLGREESRSGRLLDRRDYCKLHIIAHTVAVLLGPAIRVYPVGAVGNDAVGQRLREEMQAAGLDLRQVRTLPDLPTLFAICYVYPDGAGGNLTVNDSASAHVAPDWITGTDTLFPANGSRTIVLAVPEVPLETRQELLRTGTRHGAFRAASFASGEMETVRHNRLLANVDYLAINAHEATLLAGIDPAAEPEAIARQTTRHLHTEWPHLRLTITAGKAGSWAWDGSHLTHQSPPPVAVASTAGAGDAFMSGMLAGHAAGLSWQDAQQLATLTGAGSVTSPHTIHPGLDRTCLHKLVLDSGVKLAPAVAALLENPS
ncbi:MAG: hypothetical protein A2498_13900 [Lentisphaerae bacterium RIFOXYC12_FULL_60_16]|nr:MAG: hypothetical protein A2498_13900 [Lentisphaerae bacterium RIFOXYC12_FULL_60_16]